MRKPQKNKGFVRPPDEDDVQEMRDRFKGDPDAFFAGGDEPSAAARRRMRRRERYAARLAEGFSMNPDYDQDVEDDDAE